MHAFKLVARRSYNSSIVTSFGCGENMQCSISRRWLHMLRDIRHLCCAWLLIRPRPKVPQLPVVTNSCWENVVICLQRILILLLVLVDRFSNMAGHVFQLVGATWSLMGLSTTKVRLRGLASTFGDRLLSQLLNDDSLLINVL